MLGSWQECVYCISETLVCVDQSPFLLLNNEVLVQENKENKSLCESPSIKHDLQIMSIFSFVYFIHFNSLFLVLKYKNDIYLKDLASWNDLIDHKYCDKEKEAHA